MMGPSNDLTGGGEEKNMNSETRANKMWKIRKWFDGVWKWSGPGTETRELLQRRDNRTTRRKAMVRDQGSFVLRHAYFLGVGKWKGQCPADKS